MSNPVFEGVRTALAVRKYQDRQIPADVVDRIVEAGDLTASSINQQPWPFGRLRRQPRSPVDGPHGVGGWPRLELGGFGHRDGVREQVGLPDIYEVLGVVPFGYPRHAVKGKKNRKPVAEVASLGR
jgi:nitroreductase